MEYVRYVVPASAIKNILPKVLGTSFCQLLSSDSSLCKTIGGYGIVNGAQTAATTLFDFDAALVRAAFYYLTTTAMTALLKQMEQRST